VKCLLEQGVDMLCYFGDFSFLLGRWALSRAEPSTAEVPVGEGK